MRPIAQIKAEIAQAEAHLAGEIRGTSSMPDSSRRVLYGHRIQALKTELATAEHVRDVMNRMHNKEAQ